MGAGEVDTKEVCEHDKSEGCANGGEPAGGESLCIRGSVGGRRGTEVYSGDSIGNEATAMGSKDKL